MILPSGEVTETPAYSSLGPVLIYVFTVVVVLGITLSLIPLTTLRFVLRLLFALMFSWGAFIATVFYLPLPFAITIGIVFGTVWFLIPFIWLHDLALILALASLGAVFGRFITPWTVMLLILLLAIYDFGKERFCHTAHAVKGIPLMNNGQSLITSLLIPVTIGLKQGTC